MSQEYIYDIDKYSVNLSLSMHDNKIKVEAIHK